MSQERQGPPPADDAIEVEDEVLEAPERREADELMDHGAAGELGPMRHSAAHVLAEAVLDLFPGTKLGIGPVIDDGFYYDFLLPRPLTPEDLPKIETQMRESVAADHPFELSEETP
ncbi:MAG: threonyl-tRNA synthetase, partial [Chloroflexota bacterium]|nr:threonyl-tRNA synthetase [Chloroflexota bacterium]